MQGIFITFEGADGSGKSTQIELLKQYLYSNGYDIIVTREPGGTVISETIRELILDVKNIEMSHSTEALLYAAARAQHVNQLIKPALLEGKAVICDRFVDSSAVYQGIARGLGIENVYSINEFATGGLKPHFTFLLDIDAETGLKRKKNQAELDRLEMEKVDFHKKVVEGYRLLAKKNPERIISLDATQSPQEIQEQIISHINNKLKFKGEIL